jgi:hypothetical protein
MGGEMSDIPLARDYLDITRIHLERAAETLRASISLMTRESPKKRAPPTRQVITAEQRRKVMHLWLTTNMTQHQICTACGLANAGRVSDIVNGVKRKVRVKRAPKK